MQPFLNNPTFDSPARDAVETAIIAPAPDHLDQQLRSNCARIGIDLDQSMRYEAAKRDVRKSRIARIDAWIDRNLYYILILLAVSYYFLKVQLYSNPPL